jgi:hypothetical protein
LGDLSANDVPSFNLTPAKQFLIEIEANLRFLSMSALVIAFGTRLNFLSLCSEDPIVKWNCLPTLNQTMRKVLPAANSFDAWRLFRLV